MNKLHTLKQQLKSISTAPNWTSAFDNFLDPSRTVLSSTITLSNPVNVFDPITLPAGYRIVGYGVRLNDDVSFDQRKDSKVYYPQFTMSTLKSSPTNSGATSDEILNISSSNHDLNNLTSGSTITDDLTGEGGVQGPFYSNEPFGSIVFGTSQMSYYANSSSIELSDGELATPAINKGVLVSHFDESWYGGAQGGQGYSEINYWGGYDAGSSQAMSPQRDINYYFKLGFVTLNTTSTVRAFDNDLDVYDFPATGKVDNEGNPFDMYTSYVKPEALINPTATATAYLNIQKII